MRISNIVYNIDQISIQNIFLLENKRNIIMDGKFTKIVYSDDLFMTNGIFINVPFLLDHFSMDNNSTRPIQNVAKSIGENENSMDTSILSLSPSSYTKCFLLFKSADSYNEKIIQELIRIEYCILEFYKQIFKCGKKTTTILKSQLHNGCIKTYIDMSEYDSLSKSQFPMKHEFVLKISGIWEDYGSIGLTYKFIARDSLSGL